MTRLARLASGRRSKWFVVLAWAILLFASFPLASKLSGVTDDRTQSSLPKNAESTKVLNLESTEFKGGQTQSGLIVYQRPGGLTAADKARIAADMRKVATDPRVKLVRPPVVPYTKGAPPQLVARDGSLAYALLTVPDDNDHIDKWGKAVREDVNSGANRAGLNVYVTGSLGFSTDFSEVFGSLDTKLLLGTVILVLFLLGLIYRAPLIAITPLIVVFVAYSIAQGLIYLYAKAGNTVNQQSTSILIVLMFGVGTDYCLLLVSRYREELRHFEDKHQAMRRALERVGPAIIASGLTVTISMLCLLAADSRSTQSLGPVAAIGIASAFIAGVTLLPAMLAIYGRKGFWPRRANVEFDPEHQYVEKRSAWRRFGDSIVRSPGLALGATTILLGAGAFGILAYKEDYSTTGIFKKKVESVQGFKALRSGFPAGTLAPTTVIVHSDRGKVTVADVNEARARLAGTGKVAFVGPPQLDSKNGDYARFQVSFSDDPFTKPAIERVANLRDRLDNLPGGLVALVGDGSAQQYDYNVATEHDIKIIVPLALAVIAVILGVLLSAVLAPIVLMLTVILSFAATLGLSLLFIRYVVGDAGVDNSLPTYAFIFLVALGTDYTIFLMSRVREEARTWGTREGVLRALGATGPVITSAGLILAGTFSILMTLPATFLFNIGFLVALGILLDTFVVRTIMVPALVELIGDRIWWPSTARGGGVLRERTEAEPEPEREAATAR
jgi:RND superfamily putative drug exporter